jgi:phage-related holin
MKLFFSRLIIYFLAISVIDIIVDIIYYQSIESTILAGNITSNIIIFIVVLIGTIIFSILNKAETPASKDE